MKRYAIVTHHVKDQELRIDEGRIIGQQPGHDLMRSYHWFRLDDEHIMVSADYHLSRHAALHAHEKISMLAHTGSNKPVHEHIHNKIKHEHKGKHWHALKKHLDLDETHTMEDMIDKIVEKHGPMFHIHA